MRSLYSLLLYLSTPFVLLHFFLRGLRNPSWLRRWPERFGRVAPAEHGGDIVVHAVSVGEVNVAATLLRELARRMPDARFCLTTFTPTGSDRVRALFGASLHHVYLPLDLPGSVRRFLDRLRPRLLIVLETEIWPNLYHEASARGIPVIIANARISDRSLPAYRRLRALTGSALARVSGIGAQSERDAERMAAIGADPATMAITGNLKFDLFLPPSLLEQGEALRAAWGRHRPVLLGGSTHDDDERALLDAFGHLRREFPEALLILVPRHPERFARAAQLARGAGLRVALRSEGLVCPADAGCFVVDSMGELLRFYAACDVAFLGGTLATVGGHNALEPAALARPLLVGPHTANIAEITQKLLECGAARQVRNEVELEAAVRALFGDAELRDRMGRAGQALVRAGQGAVNRTLDLVLPLLTEATG